MAPPPHFGAPHLTAWGGSESGGPDTSGRGFFADASDETVHVFGDIQQKDRGPKLGHEFIAPLGLGAALRYA
eukprot:5884455-Pyramimonas_sp.AAC.1